MAVGIALVFGVLRLINFAYGQLIMAGAYTLALTSDWRLGFSITACFAVVIALSVLMERVVFRPLRTASPAVMLVTTFAVAFLLQSIALLKFGTLGELASALAPLAQPITCTASTSARSRSWPSASALSRFVLTVLIGRTRIGLHMRAAAADFRPPACLACARTP